MRAPNNTRIEASAIVDNEIGTAINQNPQRQRWRRADLVAVGGSGIAASRHMTKIAARSGGIFLQRASPRRPGESAPEFLRPAAAL